MDVLNTLGKIDSPAQALDVFKEKMDAVHLDRISNKNPDIIVRIANAIVLCNPDRVYVNTGSAEDKAFIRSLALEKKEERSLAMDNHLPLAVFKRTSTPRRISASRP